jgi:hypothetical protein
MVCAPFGNFSFFAFPFGTAGDVPSPGDYDGDRRFDAAIFRPSQAWWFVNRTSSGVLIQQFGISGDRLGIKCFCALTRVAAAKVMDQMRKRPWRRIMKSLAKTFPGFIMSLLFVVAVNAQTSVFTYQGKLSEGGVGANGIYDMQFRLFDATTGSGEVGTAITVNGVQVTAGIFTVKLDFGAGAFPGADRFLEVAIRPTGQSNFTALLPRQMLNSSPYALQSRSAQTASDSLSLGGIPANQFVLSSDPRMTNARTPLPGSNDYVQNGSTAQAGVNFHVAGTGTAGVINAVTQFDLNGSRILSAGGTENLFAGRNAGALNTSGTANAFFGSNAGMMNTSGSQNTFVGSDAGINTTIGGANSFFGRASGQRNTSGNGNSFFGFFAGLNNTSGANNAFFGRSAGLSNTTGSLNSFVGDGAGFANTTGTGNSFVGDNAGNDNTTGNENVFIGQDSGNLNTSTQVNNSVAIGKSATVSASNSVAIGASASVTQPNTIVLGTASQKTLVEGRLRTGQPVGVAAGDLPGRGYMETFFVTTTFQGIYTPNVIFGSYISNLLGSVIPCVRFQGITGQTAGVILTNCASALSSVNDKTEVKAFNAGIDIVKRLEPVTFVHKENGARGIGLNVEDVANIDPSLVQRDADLSVNRVNETSLNMVLINAIKQQQANIDTQQAQILYLQRQIDELTKLLCLKGGGGAICKQN